MTTVAAPASKSVSHRMLLLAAQAPAGCVVHDPSTAGHVQGTLRVLHALGCRIEKDGGDVRFIPAAWRAPTGALDAGEGASTVRLLAPSVARLGWPVVWDGAPALRRRPMASLADALRRAGARVDGDRLPLRACGPIRAGAYEVAGPSSQVASGLLMALPMVDGTSVLRACTPSAPYLDVTLACLEAAGIRFERDEAGNVRLPGSQQVRARSLKVDGDWSAAALVWAWAAIHGRRVRVTGLGTATRQGDQRMLAHLAAFGCSVHRHDDGATVTGSQDLASPGIIPLGDTPDLLPPLAAVAAVARGTTTFTQIAHVRGKESDRIDAMLDGLGRLGVRVGADADSLTVTGGPLVDGRVEARGDHRIAMALRVLHGRCRVTVDGLEGHVASWPGFTDVLARLEAA